MWRTGLAHFIGHYQPAPSRLALTLWIRTGVAGNVRGNPPLYRHFLPGGELDQARTDSGPGQIGEAARSNRSAQGYLGLPLKTGLSYDPVCPILTPFPKAGLPKIYTDLSKVRRVHGSDQHELRGKGH